MKAKVATLLLGSVVLGTSLAQGLNEDQLRAAFVLRLAQFTQWPAGVPDGPPLWLCAAGLRPSGVAALKGLESRVINGLPVRVRVLEEPAEAERNCQVLLLGQPDAATLRPWLAGTALAPLLTMATSPEALRAGAGVALISEPQGMAFAVNHSDSKRRGLLLAAPVLKLAREVR